MVKNKAKRHKSRTTDLYRIVIVGSSAVGKSALTFQFVYDEFVEFYDSIRVDSYRKNFSLDDENVTVQIVDTTGQDTDLAALDSYFRIGEGFLCVFSITDDRSFQATTELREHILRVNDKYEESGKSLPFILVGSKGDLNKKRKVTAVEAESRAREWGVPYIETSALNRNNTTKVFFDLICEIGARRQKDGNTEDSGGNQGIKKKNIRKRVKCSCTAL